VTIASTTNRVSYAGNGSTLAFAFSHPYRASTDLVVTLRTVATGAETLQVEGTNYSVTGTPTTDAGGFASGTVTFTVAPAAGTQVHIDRVVPRTQPTDYVAGDGIPPSSIEGSLDRLTLQVQELDSRFERTLLQPRTAANRNLVLPEPTASDADKVLSVNGGGTAFVLVDPVGGIEDGNKGDITVSGAGATLTINADAVTTPKILDGAVTGAKIDDKAVSLSKMADVSTGTVFYRKSASTGAPEVQSLATLKTDLGLTGTNSGDQTISLTGDVTGSGSGSFAATIADEAVTNAKLAHVATARIKGRVSASTGDVEDLTGTQATTLLDEFTSSAKGLAPASGGGSTNFLRADGQWAAPAGGGGGGGSQNLFETIAVSGQNSIVADSTTDTLTFAAGTNIALTTNATTDTLTIATTGLAASATTDATNASNIGSGTLDAARLPQFTGGDVTTSAAGSVNLQIAANAVGTTEIADGAVTLAKMANMATSSLIYRKTAGSGAPEVNTLATLKTDLGLTGTNSGDQTITLTGDVTGSGTGSFTTAIGTGVIVNADVNASAAIDATKLSFLQAGTNAVARTVDSKLEDVVSVRDFGASPSASASVNKAAFDAAIAAANTLYVPRGAYSIDDTLLIEKSITIFGDGPSTTSINFTGDQTKNIIHFRPPSVTATGNGSTVNYTFTFPTSPIKVVVNGSETTAYTVTAGSPNTLTFNTAPANGHSILITPTFLNNVQLRDIRFARDLTASVTPGTGVWFERCNNSRIESVASEQSNYCFRLTGGQLMHLSQLSAFGSSSNLAKGAKSALLFCEEATLGTNAFQPFYTTNIYGFIGSATVLDNCIRVESCDGLNISGLYINFAQSALMEFSRSRAGTNVTAVNITKSYFDCMNIDRTPTALRVTHAAGFNGYGIYGLNVSNSILANGSSKANGLIEILRHSYMSLTNNYIANVANPRCIYIDDANNTLATGQVTLTANTFSNVNTAVYTGNGSTTAYAFSFSQTGLVVTVNGVAQTGGGVNYSVSGTAPNSTLTFNTAPPAGQAVVISSTEGGAIYAKNVRELSIVGNTFDAVANSTNVVRIDGTTTSLAFAGNTWNGADQSRFYVDSGATITNRAVVLDSLQDNIGADSNEIVLNQFLGSMAYLDADNISFDARGTNTAEQNLAVNKMTTVVISADTTLTTTVPKVGSTAYVVIITSGATSRTVTFGTGFKSSGTLATGTDPDRRFVFEFISDGTNLVEVSRTSAITY